MNETKHRLRGALRTLAVFILFLAMPDYVTADADNWNSVAPGAVWIDSDSGDITRSNMMARYECFKQNKSQVDLLSYEGGTLWTRTVDVAACGNVLFVLNINGLLIFDITDATDPILINKIYMDYSTQYGEMRLDGEHLYIARYDQIRILEISDPLNPTEVSRLYLSGLIMDLHVENGYAYFGITRAYEEYDNTPALYIYDVSDPANPVIAGKYESSYDYKECRNFSVVGDYIYSINYWNNRLQTISIVDKTQPTAVNSEILNHGAHMTHHDNLLFVAFDDTLKVFDISTPDAPSLAQAYKLIPAKALGVNDGLLYYGYHDEDYNGYVNVYDIATDGSLDSIGHYNTAYPWNWFDFEDTLLFIADGFKGFTIADNSDPANLATLTEYQYRTSCLRGLDISGDYAYLTNFISIKGGPNNNGLYTVDISDKKNPQFISKIAMGHNPEYVHATDNNVFVTNLDGTQIYSLSNPGQPLLASQFPPGTPQTKANFVRDTILFTTGPSALDIGDISDPANPVAIFHFRFPGWYFYSSIPDGNVLYTTQFVFVTTGYRYYLGSWDISDIANPTLENRLLIDTIFPMAAEIVKRGGYIYSAAMDGCLHVIDISNPFLPDKIYHYLPFEEDP